MIAQDLKNAILQLAVQGKLVSQDPTEGEADVQGIKQKPTEELDFDIPQTWKTAHIECISNTVPSKQFQILESEVRKTGHIPVISQSKEYTIGFTDVTDKVFHHDVPVIAFGDHTTEVKYITFDFVVGADGVKIFEPNTEIVFPQFLYYALLYYTIGLNKVGGYSRHYKFIKNKPIPIPPLSEQHRIVAKIEELMPLVVEYGKAEEHLTTLSAEFLDKLRKSILQQAIQGKLTECNPADEPASELLKRIRTEKEQLIKEGKIKKEKPLPPITEEEIPFEIPENWTWVRLSDIAWFQGGYAYKSNTYVKESGNQLIRLGNVKNDIILFDVSPVFLPDVIAEETADYRIKKDDILFTMTGTKGKRDYFYTVVVKDEHLITKKLFLNQRVGCLRRLSSVNVDWLSIFLKSETILDQIFATSTGNANQGNIGSENTMKLLIPLPPLVEQQRIVDRVNELLAVCDELK